MSLEGIRSLSSALSMKYRVIIFLAAILLAPGVTPLLAHAEDDAQPGEIKAVTPEVAGGAVAFDQARTNVADAARLLREAQVQLAGRDSEYARLLGELRSINSNVVARREELDLIFKSKPAWQAAEKARSDAYTSLQQARENEQARQQTLAVADATASKDPAGDQHQAAEQAWIAAVDARQQAQLALEQAEQAWLRVQHQVSYEDPDGQRLHAEIKRLEGELIRVRQAKAVREKLDATWRTADAQRRRAYVASKDVPWHAQVVRQELGNTDGSADGPSAVEAENP